MTDFRYENMSRIVGGLISCDVCQVMTHIWYNILNTETGKHRWLCPKCWDEIKWEAKP